MATSTITAPFFMRPRSSRLHEPRRSGSGDQDRADDQVGALDRFEDRVPVGIERRDVGRHDVVEVAQAVEVDVEDPDVGAQAGGDLGRVGADDSAAQDGDLGRGDARHAGEQDSAPFLGPLQVLGPFLDAHPAGDLAHRRQERQAAARSRSVS